MPPSTIAGRYVIEHAVGHGGMGTVWLCRDELLGRQVAVKEVGNMPGQSTSDLARALREARNSAALNHRNVVSVFDAVEDGERNWLIMEYVPSRTLSEVVGQDGPLTPQRAVWIGAQAADGLAAAHEHGTMHRDVKPGNILVTADDHVKITDFGIARNDRDAQLTRSGVVTGTPAYFAPELAKGEEPTAAADVWALGATLYAAVEGRLPYPDQSNAIALLTTIASGPPLPPERAGFLTEAIDRMMDRDPRTRWTMADAAHALHRLHEQHKAAATLGTMSLGVPLLADTADPVDAEPEAESGAAPADVATAETEEPTEATSPPSVQTEEPTEQTEEPVHEPAPAAAISRRSVDDGEDRPASRRYAWVAAAVLLVALAAAGLYGVLNGGADDPATDEPRSSATEKATPTAEDDEGSGPDETNETEATEAPSPEGTSNGDADTTTDPATFVKNYYAHLPSDTRSAWNLLGPAMQAKVGSYGNYRGFWRTISAVSVDRVTNNGTTVDVRVTYTKGGSQESETRRLQLERADSGFRIVGDQVI